MISKKTITWSIVSGLALGVFLYTLTTTTLYSPEIEVPLSASVGSVKLASVTQNLSGDRISIPSINVNAKIQNVGINLKGNMSVPNNFTDVGWYKYGPVPGENGNAVLAGHIDNGIALPGVFKHLAEVEKGDEIYFTKKDGTKLTFVVTEMKTYDYNASTEDIFVTSGPAQLKLITCTGVWVQKLRTHDKRLVVTAVLVR